MNDKYISLLSLESFLDLLKNTFGRKETVKRISDTLNENILNIDYTEINPDFNNVLGKAVLGELILK